MKPSILRELQALRQTWRDNNFKLTPEQDLRYQTLIMVRRGQVKDWEEQGLVA